MNIKQVAGIALIALGVIAFIYQGITYTKREKVVDLGPIQATAEKEHTVPLPPVAGAIFLVGGVALVVLSRK
jgi:hypothetical protein